MAYSRTVPTFVCVCDARYLLQESCKVEYLSAVSSVEPLYFEFFWAEEKVRVIRCFDIGGLVPDDEHKEADEEKNSRAASFQSVKLLLQVPFTVILCEPGTEVISLVFLCTLHCAMSYSKADHVVSTSKHIATRL